jgi:putative transcriptional regulator
MISYAPLRALLARQKRTFKELRENIEMGTNTAEKLKNDSGYVALEVIDRICKFLHCSISDVVEHIPDSKE